MIIPEKILIGFQNRIPNLKYGQGGYYVDINGEKALVDENYPHYSFVDEEKYKEHYIKYSFITFKEGKTIRKEYSWNQWRDKRIESIEMLNVPTEGFTLIETYQRSRDWFGSGRSVWQIKHPQGFIFEITSDNLEGIIANCDIIKGEIKGQCILAWNKAQMSLIPISSEEYQKSVQDTLIKTLGKSVKINKIDIGDKVLLASNQEAIYLGRYRYSLQTKSESYEYYKIHGDYNSRLEFVRFKNFKYAFEVEDKIIVISLPKISKIISKNNLTKDQAEEKLFNIPIYKIKIFNHDGYPYMLYEEIEDIEKIISINSKTITKQEYSSEYYYENFKFKDNKVYFNGGKSLSHLKNIPFTYNVLQLNYKEFSKQIL